MPDLDLDVGHLAPECRGGGANTAASSNGRPSFAFSGNTRLGNSADRSRPMTTEGDSTPTEELGTMRLRTIPRCIVPPRLLRRLLSDDDPQIREAALTTLLTTARLRGQRELLSQTFAPPGAAGLHRNVYNAGGESAAPSGKLVRGEAGPL